MLEYVKGDMVEAIGTMQNSLFAHGCNCFSTMRSGIAKQLVDRYPNVELADDYDYFASNSYHDKHINKLGGFTLTTAKRTNIIMNLYTQYDYGTDKVRVNYPAIRMCFNKINTLLMGNFENSPGFDRMNKTINIPKIGCGLAGGDWNIVEQIIKEEFDDSITVRVWERE